MASQGVDFSLSSFESPETGEKCQIKIWDTAGQERFKKLTDQYFRTADGVIITFSLTNERSFKEVRSWLKKLRSVTGQTGQDPIPSALVGNKLDLVNDRVVDIEQARAFAEAQGMVYHETSAKTGDGIKALMDDIKNRTYKYAKEVVRRNTFPLAIQNHEVDPDDQNPAKPDNNRRRCGC